MATWNGEQQEAFGSLYRDEFPRMLALAVAMTRDREVAVELTQEAMMRALASWPKVSQLERPGAWLRRVLINLAIDQQRRSRTTRATVARLASRPSAFADEPSSDEFWCAVGALPQRQRAVVVLHYIEDMSVADIAATLRVRSGTVKSNLSKARASLARSMRIDEVSDGSR